MLLSCIFYNRAHLLYSQVVLKCAYARYLEVAANSLCGLAYFADAEAVRLAGGRVANRLNMILLPIIYAIFLLFVLWIELRFDRNYNELSMSINLII